MTTTTANVVIIETARARFMQKTYEIIAKNKIDRLRKYIMEQGANERKNRPSPVSLRGGSVDRL